MNDKIFIQIAAYRDPQLVPTIKDCIKKAAYPENLVFAIAWQHSENDVWDNLDEFRSDTRFKIIDIPYNESTGACWARNTIQRLYNNETYTLQLDSHHRFVENWDHECIEMYKQLQKKGYEKPLLTAYLPSFSPGKPQESWTQVPWKMSFDKFIPEGAIFFLPSGIENFQQLKEPIPARFYSAHFTFTTGKFCKEVPHDPEYYFHGEEISIAARAYTWGYDLFHPHKLIAWHEYTRNNRKKQWDDDKEWIERNKNCHLRNRKLFGMDNEKQDVNFGRYGFGPYRTLQDYEQYAGVSFARRAVQQYTIDDHYPPNPPMPDVDTTWNRNFSKCITIDKEELTETDYDFWVIAFQNDEEKEIHRKDVSGEEINTFMEQPGTHISICREFKTHMTPTKVVFWPHSESKGFMEKIIKKL